MEGVMCSNSLDAEIRSLLPTTEVARQGIPKAGVEKMLVALKAAKKQQLCTWFQQNGAA
jgi:hypothetical protein